MVRSFFSRAATLGLFLVVSFGNAAAGERFVIGVGAEIMPMSEGARLVISSVTPGSPADRAGLKDMDVLLEIDDKPVLARKGNSKITEWLSHLEAYTIFRSQEIGRTFRFKVIRGFQSGKPREIRVDVTVARYDRLAEVLRPQSIFDVIRIKNGGFIEFSSSVAEKKSSDKFVYRYKISNKSPGTVLVNWELLDEVLGGEAAGYIVKLAPKEVKEVIIESAELPKSVSGLARVWSEGKLKSAKGVMLSREPLFLTEGGTVSGFIPTPSE